MLNTAVVFHYSWGMVICGPSFSPAVIERIGGLIERQPEISRRASGMPMVRLALAQPATTARSVIATCSVRRALRVRRGQERRSWPGALVMLRYSPACNSRPRSRACSKARRKTAAPVMR